MSKKHIMIVEDDEALAEVLDYNLRQNTCDVTLVENGKNAVHQAARTTPDLVLLDLMLPGMDGIEVCRHLRTNFSTKHIPIILLTAKSEEIDQLIGFSVGADDYVTKPFSVNVLLQRIKTLLRSQEPQGDQRERIVSQGLSLDCQRHQATAGDETLQLTKSEFLLLKVLMRHKGRAFNRPELIDAALGDDAIVLERTFDVHIRALRKKLGSYANLIETIRGVGYRFHDPR